MHEQFGSIDADMYSRILGLREIARHKSLFLLGPRQTGKSTLVRDTRCLAAGLLFL